MPRISIAFRRPTNAPRVPPPQDASSVYERVPPRPSPLTLYSANPHRVPRRRDDARRRGVEHRAVGERRAGKRKRDLEAVPLVARDEVDVVVQDVLPSGLSTADDYVEPLGTSDLPHYRGELEGDAEQMHRELLGDVGERRVVLARRHQYVTVVHRLDVHERDRRRVLVADRHLGGAGNEVAEGAVRGGFAHASLEVESRESEG